MTNSAVGYCTPLSIRSGEPVALHLSGDGVCDIEVVRDARRPEVMWTASSIALAPRAVPDTTPERGCGWPTTVMVPTAPTWPTGVYVVRLGVAGRDAPATAWFAVRAAAPSTDRILLALATNTWNAYNDFGGRNLYTGATTASFERPLPPGFLAKPSGDGERVTAGGRYAAFTDGHGLGFWHGMAGWAGQERRFVHWAEGEGLSVDVAINADLERSDALHGYNLYVSVGHDEYWTAPMRDTVETFVSRGGRAAFLSGNTCYWQVRLEGSAMVAYKHRFEEDPAYSSADTHLTTTMWSDPLTGRPETSLTGVSFTRGGYSRVGRSSPRASGGYEVHRPDHWMLAGTRLRRGDQLGASSTVVGYECDGCDLALVDGLPAATGRGGTPESFTVVATAPATPFDATTTPLPLAPGGDYELEFHARRLLGDASPESCDRLRAGHAVLGSYTRGGAVVTVGCTDWCYGLDDPVVARVTRNILRGPPP